MKIGILAFAFGTPSDIQSNRNLAKIASSAAKKFGAPVYTQNDIQILNGTHVEYTPQPEGEGPPPTLRIARRAMLWAKKLQLERLYIVCASPHERRCYRDSTYAADEAGLSISICVLPRTDYRINDDEWFCENSTQKRTQSKKNWNKRELLVRLMPFWLYKKIAA